MKPELAQLPGLGPQSAAWLTAAGIPDRAALAHTGAIQAYLRVRQQQPRVSLNLLWALEGALSGRHWQDIARHERSRLLAELAAAAEAANIPNTP
ncbi:TfoX/Sxy family protein [Chitinilyticum litopenaei]|uniref:TfoX/Sxy family protein n=1 Tax=Chitinilyticum litopenaei TaxID=1121276 RepID=UPI000424B704|nr:TfoX/Sxy family protein [Chitinilyticum litopenaei]